MLKIVHVELTIGGCTAPGADVGTTAGTGASVDVAGPSTTIGDGVASTTIGDGVAAPDSAQPHFIFSKSPRSSRDKIPSPFVSPSGTQR